MAGAPRPTAALSSEAWERPAITTCAPSSTNILAIARPMPVPPPDDRDLVEEGWSTGDRDVMMQPSPRGSA
jgi:hypothetical protein